MVIMRLFYQLNKVTQREIISQLFLSLTANENLLLALVCFTSFMEEGIHAQTSVDATKQEGIFII